MRYVTIICLLIATIAPIVDIIITLWKERKEKKIRKERNKRIEALEQNSCDDVISRQAAQAKIKSICEEYMINYYDGKVKRSGSAYAFGHALDDLPPVVPESKMGSEDKK